MKKKKPNYKCSQQVLYAVCKVAWEGCSQHLAEFQALSPKYTAEFVQARKDEIAATAATPDHATRSSSVEAARVQLKEHARTCLDSWQRLKRYIHEAYPESMREPRLKAAGKGYYRDAQTFSWEAYQGLMSSASQFIATEAEALLLNDNMPPTFPDDFNTTRDTFESLYMAYLEGNTLSAQKTDEKLRANNHLFDVLMSMMLDGQQIFRNNASIRRQFMFEQVLINVSGPGVAGFKGHVTSAARNAEPIEAALLTLSNGDTCTTDEEGWYHFVQLSAGNYSVEITAPGFVPLKIDNIEIKTGNMSNVHLQMEVGA